MLFWWPEAWSRSLHQACHSLKHHSCLLPRWKWTCTEQGTSPDPACCQSSMESAKPTHNVAALVLAEIFWNSIWRKHRCPRMMNESRGGRVALSLLSQSDCPWYRSWKSLVVEDASHLVLSLRFFAQLDPQLFGFSIGQTLSVLLHSPCFSLVLKFTLTHTGSHCEGTVLPWGVIISIFNQLICNVINKEVERSPEMNSIADNQGLCARETMNYIYASCVLPMFYHVSGGTQVVTAAISSKTANYHSLITKPSDQFAEQLKRLIGTAVIAVSIGLWNLMWTFSPPNCNFWSTEIQQIEIFGCFLDVCSQNQSILTRWFNTAE